MSVSVEDRGRIRTVVLHRPDVRNAVDRPTALALADAFRAADDDEGIDATVLWGAGGTFCSGADLKAFAEGRGNRLDPAGDGPMGPTRLRTAKPVIAAIEGHAVAGGLELACWADLRVAATGAVLGVFCRRWGVPLIDGGTVRLPHLVGVSHALDLVLTGRAVSAEEAQRMGLVHRVVPDGGAREAAEALAARLSAFPQACLRADRASLLGGIGRPTDEALAEEFSRGLEVVRSGESAAGAQRFADGAGRGGEGV